MKLHERRYFETEVRIKDILINSDKDIGVEIDTHRFFTLPLIKEDFTSEEVIYTLRGLAGRGYFEPYNRKDTSLASVKLTQKGRDEWLMGTVADSKKIFLSYSTADKILAGQIKNELDKFGFRVFLAHETLKISEEFHERIIEEIQSCKYFIALRTTNFARNSSYPDQECGIAIALGKKIVPLIINTDPKDYGFLQLRQGFKFRLSNVAGSCARLVRQLQSI